MSVLIKRSTRILIQGITTTEGRQHTSSMLEYKAEVVAGVSPGRYGQEVMGVSVYDKVSEAVKRHKVDLSVVFVPRNSLVSAVQEAMEENVGLIVICVEDIPVTETLKLKNQAREKNVMLIGPGSAGILVPGETKAGTMTAEYVTAGDIAVIGRTIGNEKKLCQSLFKEELGESVVISLGGADIAGTGFVDILEELRDDDRTEIVVIGGELRGRFEEDVARFVTESEYPKPVIVYIFGREDDPAAAHEKEKLLREAGVTVVDDIWEIGQIIKEATVEEEE
jgi:succinyl-CoA synthetase alpha subunit